MTTVQAAQRPLSGVVAADDPDGPGPPGDEGKVESVVKKWLVYEDEVVANQLQQEEIRRHYGLNRQTRQTVRGDIPVAKELQTGEELEAAVVRQRQLDELQRRTENDERIAREIAERAAAATEQERERARQRQQQRRRQLQQQQAASTEATAAAPPSSVRVPAELGPVAASARRTAAGARSQDTTVTDEELARRIQAEEHERYRRRQSEHGSRHRTADSQQRQPSARPRSDGVRLAAAANGSGAHHVAAPAAVADERLRTAAADAVPQPAAVALRGNADAGTGGNSSSGGSSSSGGRRSGSSRARPAAPVESAPPPPPFVRGNPRQDMASRRLSGGAELAARGSCRQPERQQRREDSGDFGDFYLPPGQGMSEDECRQLQEEQDAEIARLLQEQEHKRTGADGSSSSKLKQLEQHDAELARIMQEEEKLRAQKRAIKHRQRALQEARAGGVSGHQLQPQQQQQLIGEERPSAGDAAGAPSVSSAVPPLPVPHTRPASGYRGGHSDDSRLHRLSNGNHGPPSRAIPNASASGGPHLPARAGGEGEGLYDSPWDLTRVEDQLMRFKGTESVPAHEHGCSPVGDEVRLRSGDRVGNSNMAELVDPTYKHRSREFQRRLSGDFGPQSRQLMVPSVDSVPPAPTQPAPPPPSAARPAAATNVVEAAQPTDWAPIPGQRRSQRRSKSNKGGGCKQQ